MVPDRDFCSRTINAVINYYGYTHLACILNVSVEDLDRWAAGQSRPPRHVFLRILDLNTEAKQGSL